MTDPFEDRRQRGIEKCRFEAKDLDCEAYRACLAVLEAEPKDPGPRDDLQYHYGVELSVWERLCTIILDGLGVE